MGLVEIILVLVAVVLIILFLTKGVPLLGRLFGKAAKEFDRERKR